MAIRIKGLSKYYGTTCVLEALDLTVKKGSIFGLLGPNGAGKTTLISILNGLTTKTSGTVEVLGYSLDTHGSAIKAISGYVPQSYAFYPTLSVRENLTFFGRLYGLGEEELRQSIAYCLDVVSLKRYQKSKAGVLSGGLKRRLNIAIGLLHAPQILYLDEPTVGIDPQSRSYILDMIKAMNQDRNMSVVYTSHYMEEVEYLCDEVVILEGGKSVFQEERAFFERKKGKVRAVLSDGSVQEVDLLGDGLANTAAMLGEKGLEIVRLDTQESKMESIFLAITQKELRD
ncbi:MAG: ABC transporter ATP-binding protein [Campylobacterales bacterium]|nr:ABC transporter ATP-binding protein [Campylobacterales bacterium]